MLGLDENGELAYYYKDEEEVYIPLLENLVNLLQKKDKKIERLQNVIKQSVKLTDKVDDMESARDLYDLIMDIKNKLYESDKRGD